MTWKPRNRPTQQPREREAKRVRNPVPASHLCQVEERLPGVLSPSPKESQAHAKRKRKGRQAKQHPRQARGNPVARQPYRSTEAELTRDQKQAGCKPGSGANHKGTGQQRRAGQNSDRQKLKRAARGARQSSECPACCPSQQRRSKSRIMKMDGSEKDNWLLEIER